MKPHKTKKWFRELTKKCKLDPQNGQSPCVAILSCSDSRVIPEKIFGAKPGELFVVRTAGNVAGTFEMATLEFGVNALGVRVILVMGHSDCGAVKAACACLNGQTKDLTPNLFHLVAEIAPALKEADCSKTKRNVIENVYYVTQNLKFQADWAKKPWFIPCYYDIESRRFKVLPL